MAFPVVLEAPVATNPWSHRWGLSPFRITGTVTSRTEDAEGNQFTPDRMNWSQFLREGYLDIDHAYFNNNIEAAIIGVPETVIIWADRVEVTFRLVNRPDTEAIYQYIHDHPNLLGYSIAGPLQKSLFETNGTWPAIVSVALTHAPINADTNAVALSSVSRFFALYATAQRIVQDRVRFASAPEWRRFFLEEGWSLSEAHALSQWAMTHEMLHRLDSAPIRPSQLLENLLVPPDALEPLLQSIRDELDAYWHTHAGDPHFTRDGRFNSVKEAVQHLKYCQHLTKEQVAHIVGAIRMRPEFIVHPPGNPPTVARKES
jgi:hypothetical protein